MTNRFIVRGLAIVLALCATLSNTIAAQPSAAGTETPPARADVALSGKVLAASNVGDALACLSACKRTPGCSGYSFNRNAKANCTQLTGALTDVAVTGAVSCRMPCQPALASALPLRQPTATLRAHGAATPPLATRLPARTCDSSATKQC
jgi:hypothetical protein